MSDGNRLKWVIESDVFGFKARFTYYGTNRDAERFIDFFDRLPGVTGTSATSRGK